MRMTVKAQTPLSNADASVLSPKASVGKTCPPLNSGQALALGYLPHTLPFSSCAQKRLRFWDRAHHVRVLQSYVRLKYYNCVVKKKGINSISTTVVHLSTSMHIFTCFCLHYWSTTATTTTPRNYPCPSLLFCDDALTLPLHGRATHDRVPQTHVML